MHPNLQKEEFSRAYVHAVASAAGFVTEHHRVDTESVDVTLSSDAHFHLCMPKIDLQLKCTSAACPDGRDITMALPIKNYNELRAPTTLPRYLIVVLVPKHVDEWLNQGDEKMVLRKCGYYRSLRGLPATENTSSVSVTIPREQVFTAEAVTRLMRQVIKELGL